MIFDLVEASVWSLSIGKESVFCPLTDPEGSTEFVGTSTSCGFPGGSDRKASACNAGDPGLIPGLRKALEKEMATHSSILAWRIPWMEEPGRLLPTGSQKVGHD